MKHTLTRSWSSANGGTITARLEAEGGAELNIDEAIAAGATNQQVAFALDVSQLKSIYMTSDVDLTIKTNSSGAPVNTIVLQAGKPFTWINGDPALRDTTPAAITTDITTLYVTNGTADEARLRICALFDPTV